MRIVAGTARGRALAGPKPTPSTSAPRRTGCGRRSSTSSASGWRGSGCWTSTRAPGRWGWRPVSRGAAQAVLVDSDREALALCRTNTEALGFAAQVEVLAQPVARAVERSGERGATLRPHLRGPAVRGARGGAVLERVGRRGAARARGAGGRRARQARGGPGAHAGFEPGGPAAVRGHAGELLPHSLTRAGRAPETRARMRGRHLPGLVRPAHQRAPEHHPARAADVRPADRGDRRATRRRRRCSPWRSARELIREAVPGPAGGGGRLPRACSWTTPSSAGVNVLLRGLRAVSDFEYEFQLANMNRKLGPRASRPSS